jgi:integrase
MTKQEKIESVICFEILLDKWLENSKLRLKESSYVKYHNLISNHIKPSLGCYPLSTITSTMLNKFVADKLEADKNGTHKGLSAKTVKDILSVIKSALRFAKDESLLSDYIINIALPKEKPNDMRILSTDEQVAFEKFICTDMDESKLGMYLCLYTGIRIGELCALKWSDISLSEGVLTVNRTTQRIQVLEGKSSAKTKIITTDPKSNFSMRTIPLPDCLIQKLKLFNPVNQNTYLLSGEIKRFVEPRTYQYRFKAYLSRCGVKDANFHSLRHTFATRCVALGFEIKSLSEILGHANVNITLNRYVHPSIDLKRSNMNKLEALY